VPGTPGGRGGRGSPVEWYSGEAERSFREESERYSGMNPNTDRSDAASRLCKGVFDFIERTCTERSGGGMALARIGGVGQAVDRAPRVDYHGESRVGMLG
jgi:hypothetical protein